MPVRIFETDPDAQPKRRTFTKQEFAFYFRAGMTVMDERGRKIPTTLPEWRVTAADPAVADAIAQLYGGRAEEWDTAKDDAMQVLTTTDKVQIVLSGAGAIEDKLIQWGRKGPIHECDGVTSLMDRNYGEPCGCPELLMERKAAARDEMGPAPHIKTSFRLADDYDLGVGQFVSTSWDFLVSLHEVRNDLDAVGGEALCELSLELVEYTTKKGREVSYRKPVIKVIKSWSDAIAE
ncbi:hypothetical protein PV343_01360 [Streptomyces sp. WI03-4A]|uniref:recombination directionality factor n=1 Tax=Streptomyces sp. WI03-4A TaxID=3028706 RepID=UPI0029B800EE|nr:hypothetical protein [Streptomyces sp. WI03-4A]MDX2590972.1 hypothetical protein [Streptomyces sp. WI03-4A]